MTFAWLLAITFAASTVGAGILRRYALARSLLDIPNARSSHRVPTPRGGGVAIVVAFLAGTLALWRLGYVDAATAAALVGGGTIVAVVGFLDDHHSVPAGWRLLAHFVAAAWILFWLGGLPLVPVFGRELDLGLVGDLLAGVALAWLLNLYNFMDGIDGIAAIEAVTVCFGAVLTCVLQPSAGSAQWVLPALLGAAALGFLPWNFPPAKIFMGDAGSGFVGLILGAFAVLAARTSPSHVWVWIILLGVFVVDATMTLLRRLVRREKVYEAHRSHAYQQAALRTGSHRRVTLAVGAINVFWLLPLALLVGEGYLDGVLGTAIAYGPLLWLTSRISDPAAASV